MRSVHPVRAAFASVPRHRFLPHFRYRAGDYTLDTTREPPGEVLDIVYANNALLTHTGGDGQAVFVGIQASQGFVGAVDPGGGELVAQPVPGDDRATRGGQEVVGGLVEDQLHQRGWLAGPGGQLLAATAQCGDDCLAQRVALADFGERFERRR